VEVGHRADVMDLERIKQNLRLRSGRSKKIRKPVPLQLDSNNQFNPTHDRSVPNTAIQQPQRPQTQHNYEPAKDEPSLRNWDDQTALPQFSTTASGNVVNRRPNLPQAVTGSYSNSSPPKRSSRFGRSGIERPRKEPSPVKASHIRPAPLQKTMSEADIGAAFNSDISDALDFDLRPPPPRPKPPSIESLSEALFSAGHLHALLRHPQYLAQFTAFVGKYRPHYHAVILRYLETQKAIKAVEYANAIAESIEYPTGDEHGQAPQSRPSTAATLELAFAEAHSSSFQILLNSALPMYITYKLVKMATECLVNEIAGRRTPMMADLVGGLSEVFCLTDPNQHDNPIIYASEEFYRLTGYGRDDVIGRNCRFLQGANTQRESVARLRESIRNGKQSCEAFLNYRRDGRPFINLLMIAPLHDDKGNVKYHIGAQVDVTGLVEKCKGLEAFERYLVMQEIDKRDKEITRVPIKGEKQRLQKSRTLAKLRDLSQMFDLEESAVVRSHSRSSSFTQDDEERSINSGRRVVLGESDSSSEDNGRGEEEIKDKTWNLGQSGKSGLSGTLPGVYDSYMLTRAAPSLRIVFVSPKLRQRFGNVVQHPFLSHIAAPSNTLAGLKESLGTGVAVSAKVNFMLNHGERRDGTEIKQGSRPDNSRACWISATPLLGSDDNIGVWMIVVVDKRKVSAATTTRKEVNPDVLTKELIEPSRRDRPTKIEIPVRRSSQRLRRSHSGLASKSEIFAADVPIKPKRLEDVTESFNSAESTLRAGMDDDKVSLDMEKKEKKDVEEENEQSEQEEEEMVAETKEEKENGIILPLDAAQPDDKEPITGPDELSSEISKSDRQPSDDHFVRPKLQNKNSPMSGRIHIRADSDAEPTALSTADLDNALVRSLPGSRTGTGMAMDNFSSPPLSPETLNVFHGFSDDEATPRRTNHPDYDDDKSPPTPQHDNSGLDSPSGKPNGKHYMDYLRHPGSGRPSSEYNRALSGSVLVNSMYHVDDVEKHWGMDDTDEFPDRECLGSPYSVD
jgi:PAS domain S-box-containing protein